MCDSQVVRRPLSGLCAVVDVDVAERAGWRPIDLATAYLAGGARLLQLRAKTLSSGAFLDLATHIVELARPAGATVIVNDRADIARLSAADGVHVGQDDLLASAARAIVGREATVGISTHTESQLRAAALEPVTYMAIGPVFRTATKATGYAPVGVEGVRTAAAIGRKAGLEVVAIGGITLQRAAGIISAGAAAVAVISDLLAHGNPEHRVRAYVRQLTEAANV
ncbi:MAG: thiamine phosphate synthase [Blastocatellia bacterium]|nr:MAG: thiamine phosphate synthase [Blastocatellia bacterium]